MPTRHKPDLQRILEINTFCTECGFEIRPSQLHRGNEGKVICPKCGATTSAKKAS